MTIASTQVLILRCIPGQGPLKCGPDQPDSDAVHHCHVTWPVPAMPCHSWSLLAADGCRLPDIAACWEAEVEVCSP